ncbi:uncharacterized PE-PGRS family protein PE_PGRS54-like [Manacus candei]|uniref:uncharacterized PE-PGRS family protein PE_PGRS54-like n=1 Tax=Manacus candei TaxID=415023 RepID=UPI00222757DF|nr:uncharacterized PE-PGRS family protein PE_PGRS54-like [Manacus candei]
MVWMRGSRAPSVSSWMTPSWVGCGSAGGQKLCRGSWTGWIHGIHGIHGIQGPRPVGCRSTRPSAGSCPWVTPSPWKAPGWGRGAGKLEKALGVLVAAVGREPSCAQGAGGQWPRGCGSPSVGTGPGQGLSLCWELGRPPWNPGGSSGPSDRRDLEGLERVQGREGSWEGSGAAGGAEGAGGAHPGAKEAQGGPSGSASPCQEGGAGGGRALLPGNKGQAKGKRPQAGPGEGQVGAEEEFVAGKGGEALAGAAQGGLECPSLEVSQEGLAVALSALGWGTRWGWGPGGIHGLGGLFQPQGSWDFRNRILGLGTAI